MIYTILDLVGFPLIFLLTIFSTSVLFKYVASNKVTRVVEWLLFGLVGFIPVALFISLLLFNEKLDTPAIQFGMLGTVISIMMPIIIFIGISIWSKTWIAIIVPLILFMPEFLINLMVIKEETQLILSGTIVPLCLGIYFLVTYKLEKNKEKRRVTKA